MIECQNIESLHIRLRILCIMLRAIGEPLTDSGSGIPNLYFKEKFCVENGLNKGKKWKLGGNILVLHYSSSPILNKFTYVYFFTKQNKSHSSTVL